MQFPAKAFLFLAAILAMRDGPSGIGRMIPAVTGTPAGLHMFPTRIAESDTLRLRVTVLLEPGFGQTGEWTLAVPPGMTPVSGMTEGHGTKALIAGEHEVLLRCAKWGDFDIGASMTAVQDSLNLVRCDYRVRVHITADSFLVVDHPDPFGSILRQYVVDGIHYRWHGVWWLPLDPGETEEIAPGFDSSANLHSPRVVHAEAAAHVDTAPGDSIVTVPVWVAVDRSGHVKDAQLVNPNRERSIPPSAKAAALAAAWKWRFAPAQTLGRPVSTIYVVDVPVPTSAEE